MYQPEQNYKFRQLALKYVLNNGYNLSYNYVFDIMLEMLYTYRRMSEELEAYNGQIEYHHISTFISIMIGINCGPLIDPIYSYTLDLNRLDIEVIRLVNTPSITTDESKKIFEKREELVSKHIPKVKLKNDILHSTIFGELLQVSYMTDEYWQFNESMDYVINTRELLYIDRKKMYEDNHIVYTNSIHIKSLILMKHNSVASDSHALKPSKVDANVFSVVNGIIDECIIRGLLFGYSKNRLLNTVLDMVSIITAYSNDDTIGRIIVAVLYGYVDYSGDTKEEFVGFYKWYETLRKIITESIPCIKETIKMINALIDMDKLYDKYLDEVQMRSTIITHMLDSVCKGTGLDNPITSEHVSKCEKTLGIMTRHMNAHMNLRSEYIHKLVKHYTLKNVVMTEGIVSGEFSEEMFGDKKDLDDLRASLSKLRLTRS